MEAAAAAAVLSIGGAGLQAGGQVVKGIGEKASQDWLAARDERAAELGRLRADQTDVQLREELNKTLANIDAVRSAANADPLSPTAMAVKDEEARISDRDRQIKVGSIRAQADEDERSAAYRRSVGRFGLLGGIIGGLGTLGKGIASGMK